MNLLIVDDHPTNLKLLRAQLESQGHAVFEAHDGVDALDLLNRQRVDAVISDILMPRMDGYRLCHEIRAHAHLHDLPIILYTSTYTSPGDEKLALDVSADKYLKKPASVETLVAALHEVIGKPHAAPRLKALQEIEVLKEYSEQLVFKLEEKNTELMTAEAKFRALVEQSIVGIYIIQDDQLVYVNPRMAEILGRSEAEMTSRSLYDFAVPEDHALLRENIRKRISGGVPSIHSYLRVLHKSGAVLNVEVYGSLADYNGRPAVMGTLLDITERKRSEAERDRLLRSESAARAQAEAAFERLCAIQNVTEPALAYLALPELMRELLARVRIMLEADYATVFLLDEGRKALNRRAHIGFSPDSAAAVVPLSGSLSGRVASDGRALIFNDLRNSEAHGWNDFSPALTLRSAMGAPLVVGGRVTGVLMIASATDRCFRDEDLALLRVVADRVAPNIEQGRLVERIRAGRERLKLMSRRLLTAQEEERRRVAVELHDDLGQVLTAVKINLASLERQSGAAPAPGLLLDAIASIDHAMQRVRDLALDLRPSVLDDLGLAAALRWYVDRFARKASLEADLSIDAVTNLESTLETTCFRLTQEALTNVARHAHARRLWVDLHLLGDGLELRVRDDGIGFDVAAARARATGGASLGLLGMEERASLAGGEFEVLSEPGAGTSVRVHFPIGEKEPSDT